MHHHTQPYKHIVVIGNVGAGKSTLTDLLEKALPATQVPADSLFKVNPFFPLAVGDRARWSLTSDLWFLHERVKLARSIPPLLQNQHVVVDSGLPMSYVYAHSRIGSGYFTKDEWELYLSIYDELVTDELKPDIVICLKAPVKVLRERIESRGREFEVKYHSIEYLTSLQESLDFQIRELIIKHVPLIMIDSVRSDFSNKSKQLQAVINKLAL